MADLGGIDCPACRRKIADVFGDWLWKIKNCPFCFAPLMPVEDDYGDHCEFFFTTDPAYM